MAALERLLEVYGAAWGPFAARNKSALMYLIDPSADLPDAVRN